MAIAVRIRSQQWLSWTSMRQWFVCATKSERISDTSFVSMLMICERPSQCVCPPPSSDALASLIVYVNTASRSDLRPLKSISRRENSIRFSVSCCSNVVHDRGTAWKWIFICAGWIIVSIWPADRIPHFKSAAYENRRKCNKQSTRWKINRKWGEKECERSRGNTGHRRATSPWTRALFD